MQDLGFVWRVLYYPVSAFITLFANILQTPEDSRARSDLRLMGSFVEFLSKLQHEESHEVGRIFRVCSEFERIARDVVERAERIKEQRKDRKWSNQDLETDKQQYTNRNAVPLTPVSATVGNGLGYNSPPMYGRPTTQSFPSTLDDSGLGSNQFSQPFPGLMGSALNPYAEVQPMFPNGLTMPWNGNTFHGSFAPDSFTTSSYGFEVGMNG